jgi:hypothetical protein
MNFSSIKIFFCSGIWLTVLKNRLTYQEKEVRENIGQTVSEKQNFSQRKMEEHGLRKGPHRPTFPIKTFERDNSYYFSFSSNIKIPPPGSYPGPPECVSSQPVNSCIYGTINCVLHHDEYVHFGSPACP